MDTHDDDDVSVMSDTSEGSIFAAAMNRSSASSSSSSSSSTTQSYLSSNQSQYEINHSGGNKKHIGTKRVGDEMQIDLPPNAPQPHNRTLAYRSRSEREKEASEEGIHEKGGHNHGHRHRQSERERKDVAARSNNNNNSTGLLKTNPHPHDKGRSRSKSPSFQQKKEMVFQATFDAEASNEKTRRWNNWFQSTHETADTSSGGFLLHTHTHKQEQHHMDATAKAYLKRRLRKEILAGDLTNA